MDLSLNNLARKPKKSCSLRTIQGLENFKSIFSGSSRDSEGHRESFLQDINKNVINISPQKEAEPLKVQPGHTLIPIHMSAMNNITNDVKSLRPNTKEMGGGLFTGLAAI